MDLSVGDRDRQNRACEERKVAFMFLPGEKTVWGEWKVFFFHIFLTKLLYLTPQWWNIHSLCRAKSTYTSRFHHRGYVFRPVWTSQRPGFPFIFVGFHMCLIPPELSFIIRNRLSFAGLYQFQLTSRSQRWVLQSTKGTFRICKIFWSFSQQTFVF